MKKLLLIISICFTLFSCAKDKDPLTDRQQNESGSLEYKVNGNQVVMDHVELLTGQYVLFYKELKGGVISDTKYILFGQNEAKNVVLMTIVTDSIHLINYHYDSTTTSLSE